MTDSAQNPISWFKRWSLPLVLLLVVLDAGTFWIADFVVNPGASGWERVMFRPGGDATYFPYVRALADGNLGEPVDYATRGQGSWNFPWLQLLPFSVLLKLFGPWGVLVADVVFQSLRWWLLFKILRLVRIESTAALWLSLLISLLSSFLLVPFYASGDVTVFSMDRLPRPLITDLILLGLVYSLLRAILSPPGGVPWRWLMAGAFCLGLTPHGDYHSIFSQGPLWAVAVVWCWWRERSQWKQAVPLLALSSLPALVLAAYWVFLVSKVPVEVSRRLGVFEFSRWEPPSLFEFYTPRDNIVFLVGLGILLVAWGVLRKSGQVENRALAQRVTLSAGVALGLCYIAPWVSLAVAGKLVQVYQFGQRLATMEYFTVAIALACVGQVLVNRSQQRGTSPTSTDPVISPWGRCLLAPFAAVLVLLYPIATQALKAARNQIPNWAMAFAGGGNSPSGMRRDFRELEHTLAQAGLADKKVLATTDAGVYSWWLSALGKGAYLVDPFETGLPDQEIEDRLLLFGRLCGAENADFIYRTSNLFYFHSTAKYQFSRSHTFVPAKYLLADEIRRRNQMHFTVTWYLLVPVVEKVRIGNRQRQIMAETLTEDMIPFDLMIVSRLHDEHLGEADPRFFEKVLENASYRVYTKREDPGNEAPPP